jgi:large-conductance mechanosensitive channel
MLGPRSFNDQKLGRTQLMTNLYGSIICLAMFSLVLGIELFSMARDLVRGDPYHVIHLTEFSVIAMVVAIVVCAFSIHRWVQRLAKLDRNKEEHQISPEVYKQTTSP